MRTAAVAGVLAVGLPTMTASAVPSIESIGAEKCGGRVRSLEVEFLAPDNATVQATAKALVKGAPSMAANAVTLSVDGKECSDARCGFSAKKGQTYKIVAKSGLSTLDDLCIVVARPSP